MDLAGYAIQAVVLFLCEQTNNEERNMSANNWTICPRCKEERKELIEKHRKKVDEGYGILSMGEFLESLKAINDEEEEMEDNLREDYEMFTDEDGLFYISYTCYCTECNFKHSFTHEEQLVDY